MSEPFESPGLTAEQRARDIMRRFVIMDNGLLEPCDAVELEDLIVRAIKAAKAIPIRRTVQEPFVIQDDE